MLRRGTVLKRALHTYTEASKSLFPTVSKFNASHCFHALPTEIIADRGDGCYIWDTNGNKYLDFTSGIGVVSTGHSHPRVAEALAAQAKRLYFAQQNILPVTPAMIDLLERLKRITPDTLTRFFFCQSGSEAVDNAIKLARASTGRQNVIAFQGGYHGRTYGAMSITTSKTIYRQSFGPLPSGTAIANYPYCLHCKARTAAGGLGHGTCEIPLSTSPASSYESRKCCNSPLDDLHMMFKTQSHPKDTAAIIIEPILGEGGFLVPPPGFLTSLRELCDEHGIVLVFDEVQAGLGRTGTWWSHQLLTTSQPDILIFAKGIASGFPFAGLAAREDLFTGAGKTESDSSGNARIEEGMMGGTYGAGPMGCAAAVATIDVIEDEKLLENATKRGEQLAKGLNDIASRGGSILEVRGRGLMVAAELKGSPGIAAKAVKVAGQHGVLMLTAGARETVRFLPPLVVNEAQVDRALEVFEAALKEANS